MTVSQPETPVVRAAPAGAPKPGAEKLRHHLAFGVILPALVMVIELATRMCAEAFFDPMPTVWHMLAVAFVPAANLALWYRLSNAAPGRVGVNDRWLVAANGAAIAISAFYALIFLPLLPLAIIAILLYGIGFLPMAPLAAFCVALAQRSRLSAALGAGKRDRHFIGGLVAGIALLLALDVPAASTRLGIQWASSNSSVERERGLSLLRTFGDRDLLLRLCYDAVGRPAGLLSAFVMVGGNLLEPEQRQVAQSPAEVREIYYRVAGAPFNSKPSPFKTGRWAAFGDFEFDADHGGAEVGGRIKGLDIVSSRIDASVSGPDGTAYLEWILEFRNTSMIDREARMQIALPPGGVVSRATLWVNGEEREAAYGGRAEVRAAYQRVAVQQRRDPLLVTTRGADRVLAQAFPVGRNGGTIKFKIGITAPLDLIDAAKAQLVLPAIFDRNFSFAQDVTHAVWIESKQPLTTSAKGLAGSRASAGQYRLAGPVSDRDLARPRATVVVERGASNGALAAKFGEGETVVQDVASGSGARPTALMLVVDGSARVKTAASQLASALRALPPETRLGIVLAGEPAQRIALAPATEAHKERVASFLRAASFVGGQDNGPALSEAMQALEAEPTAKLVWVHAPQPIAFRRGAAQLDQITERMRAIPDVVLYAVESGPNELLPDKPWGWAARTIPQTAGADVDLGRYLAREFAATPAPKLRRVVGQASDGLAKGSEHIARLWAKDRVAELMSTGAGDRAGAVALAVKYRLVTPISGAVVLETQQQYDESRLTPVAQGTVPTIPEPHEWALLLIACAALGWLAWQRRQQTEGLAR